MQFWIHCIVVCALIYNAAVIIEIIQTRIYHPSPSHLLL